MTVSVQAAPASIRRPARRPEPGALPAIDDRDPRRWVRAIAAIALVLLGARIMLPQGIEVGFVAAAVLIPVWVPAVRTYRWGWALLGTGVVAAVMGWWLDVFNQASRDTDSSLFTSTTALLVGGLLGFGLVLWARRVLTESSVGLWFGIGLAIGITPSSSLFASNPWKFGFAVPIAVISLSLAWKSGQRWLELVVLAVLTVISAVSDARSAFAILLLGTVIVAVQLIPRQSGRKFAALKVIVGLAGLTAVIYNLGQSLILDGYLGKATEARSLEQLRTSGSLILGGRPELTATLALMNEHPFGFGAGSVPNLSDVVTAKAGMASINYQPDNGYVERYMMGGHFELHSMMGDLWAHFGIAGLLFLAIAVGVAIWGLAVRIADRRASGVILFVSATSLWGVLFSPFFSAEPLFMLMLGMLVVPVAGSVHPRLNSTTSVIGPAQRAPAVNPAVVSTASSAAADAAG
ncbi:O-antigen ligase family protein [Subtercola lobariae]|uniref:O-antigen ligase domain-containing protein n=1 Tax=Subtercola lobariae TaxID=1588641 RepID=A0A917B158_9MICO|nr:hypothetical protein [Subtercola lobariae]GGF13790.1 hypothetical protein GCM10011399_04580 [Subtercola lobariae]